MMSVSVSSRRETVSRAVSEGTETAMERAAKAGFELSQDLVPVDTGHLKSSGEMVRDARDGAVTFGYAATYAVLVEEGTEPHPIEPDAADVLAFEVDGETVFAMHVDHPGTKAQPYLQPGFEEMARQFRQRGVSADIDAELKRP